MNHAEGFAVCTSGNSGKWSNQVDDLCEFSEKMVKLLTGEAARALQVPNHGGLDYAAYLLQDALKYDALYCRARGTSNEELFEAAQKLSKWHAV